MTLIAYEKHRLSKEGMEIVERANTILADMTAQGYTLTLRQLFYQFVRRNWIANSEKTYKRLGEVVGLARLAGYISWEAIEDRNRGLLSWGFEEDRGNIAKEMETRLNLDLWKRQPHYVEVWVEKDALTGVIAKPCQRSLVPHMACKGYLSLSEQWRAGLRFAEAVQRGQKPVLLYLGDHDPSGIDMTRNHEERQDLFAGVGAVDVRRLALNMDQVEEYDPPPNPTKLQDSRAEGYIAEFGDTCWELDALEPATVDKLIKDELDKLIDKKVWKATLKEQEREREVLKAVGANWPLVERFVSETVLGRYPS